MYLVYGAKTTLPKKVCFRKVIGSCIYGCQIHNCGFPIIKAISLKILVLEIIAVWVIKPTEFTILTSIFFLTCMTRFK